MKPRASVCTSMLTEVSTLATGTKTSSMASAKKNGTTEASTRDSNKMPPKKVKVSTAGPTVTVMWANGKVISYGAKDFFTGMTTGFTLVTGAITWCMVKVLINGVMVESLLVSTTKTASMVKVCICGLMAAPIMVNGKMVSNTEMASILLLMQWTNWILRRGIGLVVKGRNGKKISLKMRFKINNKCMNKLLIKRQASRKIFILSRIKCNNWSLVTWDIKLMDNIFTENWNRILLDLIVKLKSH